MRKSRKEQRRNTVQKDNENILAMLAKAPPLPPRRDNERKPNKLKGLVRKKFLNCSESGNSRMRVAIETQQLIINLEELFKNGGPKIIPKGPKPRPLMAYFHRSVEKVKLTQKRCVFQEKLQKFVFNWTRRVGFVAESKVKTREDILDDVTANAAFWDKIFVASANSGKLSVDASLEVKEARAVAPKVVEPPVYSTLQDFNARRWGSDIRQASGMAPCPHSEEGRLSSTPGFNSYLELLLWEQERRSAMQRSDWCPAWTEEDFLPSIHLPVTTLSRMSHSISSSFKDKASQGSPQTGTLSASSSPSQSPQRPLQSPRNPPLEQRPPVAFGRGERVPSRENSPSRPSSKGHDARPTSRERTEGRPSSNGRPSSKGRDSSRPSSKGHDRPSSKGLEGTRPSGRGLEGTRPSGRGGDNSGRPSSTGRNGSRGASRGKRSSAFGDLPPLPETAAVQVEIPITVTTSSMSAPNWTWPTMRTDKFSSGSRSKLSSRGAKTAESGVRSNGSGDSGVSRLHDEWSSTVSRWRDNLLAPKDGTLPPTPRSGRQATGLGDIDELTQCDDEEDDAQVIYFRECDKLGVLPSATHARKGLGWAPVPLGHRPEEQLSPRSLLAREEAAKEETTDLMLSTSLLGNSKRLVALCAALPSLSEFKVVDLSHNMLEDSSVESFLVQMYNIADDRGPWVLLVDLNLSHNRLGPRSFTALSLLLHRGLIRSRDGLKIDLGGMPLPPKPVVDELVEAIHCNGSVSSLRLNDTQFGRYTQTILHCVKDLLWCPGLRKLDLSYNYIRGDGLKTLIQSLGCSECLIEDLNLSGCSCNRPVAGLEGEVAKAHPLLPLCEALEWNNSLKNLSLADCSLNSQACLILEDALCAHPNIWKLDVSQNPLGDNGIRALVRLMASKTSNIEEVDIRSVRHDPYHTLVNFNYGDLVIS
eukprot:gnl/MRDRNA2_/MRDRNA2_79549_c0_seq1.p1 gnl/MRDRNA2_/MRDRNA2_79549_c0~~gnl/MRDRNA2_/MRDRNA2_79549_c0_seq1.p1  ORF type:complete len:927 (+),score=128.82 gnl/MRDRNA2_/MRDRNA2_79549_c0_seq1:296-3076(+)